MKTKPFDETAAKLAALRADNAQACQDLAAHLGAERWELVIKQCEARRMSASDIEALCGKMRRTRHEWHPKNATLALQAAAMGLLMEIGSGPSEADVQAFEAAQAASSSI